MSFLRAIPLVLAMVAGLGTHASAATWRIELFDATDPTIRVGTGTIVTTDIPALDSSSPIQSISATLGGISFVSDPSVPPGSLANTSGLFGIGTQLFRTFHTDRSPGNRTLGLQSIVVQQTLGPPLQFNGWRTTELLESGGFSVLGSGSFTLALAPDPEPPVVPLPASAALLPLGLGALALIRRRRARAA